MTNLRHLLASNMKENRRKHGFSQAKLAERAGLSTQYVAMIELGRKFPSPENIEQIACALDLDTPELFSMPPSVEGVALQLCRDILMDLEQTVEKTVNSAIKVAVSQLVANRLNDINVQESICREK